MDARFHTRTTERPRPAPVEIDLWPTHRPPANAHRYKMPIDEPSPVLRGLVLAMPLSLFLIVVGLVVAHAAGWL